VSYRTFILLGNKITNATMYYFKCKKNIDDIIDDYIAASEHDTPHGIMSYRLTAYLNMSSFLMIIKLKKEYIPLSARYC